MKLTQIKKARYIQVGLAGVVLLLLGYFGKDAFIFYTFNPAGRYDNQIVLYSTSSCPYCAKLKQCFASSGLEYKEKNIKNNILSALEHEALGGNGVPIVLIGSDVVIGYKIKKLNDILTKSNRKISCDHSS